MRDQASIKRYLLGKASPEERIDLENRYLADVSVFEEFTEAENDLIDCYVRGKLPDVEKREFEQRYLTSPQRRTRVEFASALNEISRESRQVVPVQKNSLWDWLASLFQQSDAKVRWALAVGVMATMVAVGWLRMTSDRSLRTSLPPHSTEGNGEPHSPSIPAALPSSQTPTNGGAAGTEIAKADQPELDELTVPLTPGISRSIGSQARTIPRPTTTWVLFRLSLEDEAHQRYLAVVETAEGKAILRVNGLTAHQFAGNRVVELRVSSHLVEPGDYVVRLSAATGSQRSEEEVEVYTFRVSKSER